ncbi:MAG TPA: transglycosylase SLT domain-containing protein [Polyangiaceae bacterium]
MSALSDAFFEKLAELGERRATDPVVFLDVWNSESGLDPSAENRASHAQGLNQMMPKTLQGLGAPADFKSLASEDQLPWIERLVAGGEKLNGGPFKTATRYYHSNFFPRTMYRGQTPATVVLGRDATDPEERAGYAANAALDLGGKGQITYADLIAFLNRAKNANRLRYEAARARLALAMRGTTPARVAAGIGPVLFMLGSSALLTVLVAWRGR